MTILQGIHHKWPIKHPELNYAPCPNNSPVLEENFFNAQVHLSAKLKLGGNLNKTESGIFVINFGRNFLIFVKNLLAWQFLFILFLSIFY